MQSLCQKQIRCSAIRHRELLATQENCHKMFIGFVLRSEFYAGFMQVLNFRQHSLSRFVSMKTKKLARKWPPQLARNWSSKVNSVCFRLIRKIDRDGIPGKLSDLRGNSSRLSRWIKFCGHAILLVLRRPHGSMSSRQTSHYRDLKTVCCQSAQSGDFPAFSRWSSN